MNWSTTQLIWIAATFLLFTVMVAVISSWKTRGDNLETAEGYFLASRSLPGFVIAGSLLLTNLSAEQLVGLNGQSWKTNMGAIAWEVGSMFTLLVLAFFFLPNYLKIGTTTIPSMMETCYDKSTKTMFSAIIVIMYSILNLPVILYSGAVVFENIFDVSGMFGITKFTAIAVLCVIIGVVGGCYAIFGGLKAVAVSDTINGVGLLIGGLMIPFLGLALLAKETGGSGMMDGIRYLLDNEAEFHKLNAVNAWDSAQPQVPWPLIITGMFFSNIYWWCCNQSFVQRSLAAKNLAEGQKGAIYCGFLKCLGPLYLVLPGIIAFYLPSIQEQMQSIAGNPGVSLMDQAYPMLVVKCVPWPVMGFFAAVMFGAILSSFNSVLNSASTMFTLDLYRSVFKPSASDVECVKVGKIYGTIAGIVAICVAPFVSFTGNGITTLLNSLANFISMPVAWTILGAIVFKNIPKWAPKLITVIDVVFYGAFLLIKPVYPTNPTEEIHYLYAIAILFFVDWIVMWACNKFAPRKEALILKDVGAVDMTPWKYRKVVAVIGIILAIAIYLLLSPLGIAASGEPTSWLGVWGIAS